MPAANQAFRGASLYSGIFDTQVQDPSTSKLQDSATAPANDSSTSQQDSASSSSISSSSMSKSDAAASDAAGPSKSSGWSAALRFAPRRTAAAVKAKARPNAAFVASFAPAAASSTDTAEPPKGALSRAPGVAPKPPSASLEPSKSAPETSPAKATQPAEKPPSSIVDTSDLKLTALALPHTDTDDASLISQLQKHPVTEPPSFTLPSEEIERDRQLIRKAVAAARGNDHYYEDDFDGAEENEDVNGFLSTRAGKRASNKRKKRRRGNSPPPGPNMNADYDPRVPNDYMSYKRLVYERRKAELEYSKRQQQQDEEEYGDEEGWEEEEEEVEERRFDRFPPPPSLLQSHQRAHEVEKKKEDFTPVSTVPTRALTGEEAYARRVAMSATAAGATGSGEEACQRRMAMSNAVSGEEAYQRRVALSQASPPGPPPGPPPSAPTPQSDLTTRQSAAVAIAARLAKLVPPPHPPPPIAPTPPSDPSTFAERLLTSQGYIPGTPLGNPSSSTHGLLTPLTITKSNPTSSRGTIYNPSQAHQTNLEAAKYGSTTASPIIVLVNMATLADLHGTAREELVEDIASECGKFGIVKRILPHLVEEKGESGEVRVFVQFSGEAGSWKAVRKLDGRWFEGRQVLAFYYDPAAFQRGELNLPLTRP
ncbi:related to conserved hypothetcial protein [Ustilago trichophora]|uniref:Related to conserved hypothetcial protein n=1 Tax=Ustilago trichophora TaxID=86804 RepID=A0A5C3EME4_9BASI|nr:related to conserved hypothetcial protein [Ustilago trichophora]